MPRNYIRTMRKFTGLALFLATLGAVQAQTLTTTGTLTLAPGASQDVVSSTMPQNALITLADSGHTVQSIGSFGPRCHPLAESPEQPGLAVLPAPDTSLTVLTVCRTADCGQGTITIIDQQLSITIPAGTISVSE
jgi:hypothetical protein